ncbi:MAG: hypothetical protein Kapaf2KO_03950 [Candidatus Kapaibacteriales bacterium]
MYKNGSHIDIAKGMMLLAGADNEISEPELYWLKDNLLSRYDDSEESFDEVKNFDYSKVDTKDYLSSLSLQIDDSEKKYFLYDAIRMCSADRLYSDEERAASKKAAEIFEVSDEMLKAIEHLIEMERAVEVTKESILG